MIAQLPASAKQRLITTIKSTITPVEDSVTEKGWLNDRVLKAFRQCNYETSIGLESMISQYRKAPLSFWSMMVERTQLSRTNHSSSELIRLFLSSIRHTEEIEKTLSTRKIKRRSEINDTDLYLIIARRYMLLFLHDVSELLQTDSVLDLLVAQISDEVQQKQFRSWAQGGIRYGDFCATFGDGVLFLLPVGVTNDM